MPRLYTYDLPRDLRAQNLVSFFEQAARSAPPPTRRAYSPPCFRVWPPLSGKQINTQCVAWRHPALEGDLFARIPTHAPRRSRAVTRGWQGKFFSWKMGRTLHARSRLELRYMEICEVEPDVSEFCEHPAQLHLRGDQRRYTPDFYLVKRQQPWFVEIKWEEKAKSARNEDSWAAYGSTLNSMGFGFAVITEHQIFSEPRSANVRNILRSRLSVEPDSMTRHRFITRLLAGSPTLGELKADLALSDKMAMRLILEYQCRIDIDQPIDDETIVRMGRP